MARYTGPKHRLQRAVGQDLGLKTNSVKTDRRLNVKPGQHGPKGSHGKMSDFNTQLKEKQKVRWTYGILENQFRKYFELATKDPKATGFRLLQLLEMRLDNTVYRLGFAPTRTAARQYVAHGHILVNGKKLDIPSYQVRLNDTIALTTKIAETPVVKDMLENKKVEVPGWLERKAAAGQIKREPTRDEIDSGITEQLIVEYYSR